MVHTLDLPNTARTGVQRLQFRFPFARVGGYAHNAAVDNVSVDGTATAAVVAACTGDDDVVWLGPDTRCLIDRASRHHILSGSQSAPNVEPTTLLTGRDRQHTQSIVMRHLVTTSCRRATNYFELDKIRDETPRDPASRNHGTAVR